MCQLMFLLNITFRRIDQAMFMKSVYLVIILHLTDVKSSESKDVHGCVSCINVLVFACQRVCPFIQLKEFKVMSVMKRVRAAVSRGVKVSGMLVFEK